MRYFVLLLMMLCLVCPAQAEQEAFVLTAEVTAETSALMALPIEDAEVVLSLQQGDVLTITALGTSYCEASLGDAAGYVALESIAFTAPEGAEPKLGWIDVSPTNTLRGRASLRSGPSTKSEAICQLPKGALLLIVGKTGDMWHVMLPEAEGYVPTKYVKDAKAAEYRVAYIRNDDPVSLRLDKQYAEKFVICTLEPGTPVQCIRDVKGWAQVEVGGYRAFIVSKYLTFDAPEAE